MFWARLPNHRCHCTPRSRTYLVQIPQHQVRLRRYTNYLQGQLAADAMACTSDEDDLAIYRLLSWWEKDGNHRLDPQNEDSVEKRNHFPNTHLEVTLIFELVRPLVDDRIKLQSAVTTYDSAIFVFIVFFGLRYAASRCWRFWFSVSFLFMSLTAMAGQCSDWFVVIIWGENIDYTWEDQRKWVLRRKPCVMNTVQFSSGWHVHTQESQYALHSLRSFTLWCWMSSPTPMPHPVSQPVMPWYPFPCSPVIILVYFSFI